MADPVRQLCEQHNQLRRLFKQMPLVGSLEVAQQRAYAICDLITIHSRLEQDVVYPVVKDLLPSIAAEAEKAHQRGDALVARINEREYRLGPEVKADVRALEQVVLPHARWEEDNVLSLLSELSNEEFDVLGRSLYERHQQLMYEYPDASDTTAKTEGYSGGPLI
jgi:hypothetical protein